MNESMFILVDEDGKETKCQILFTCELEGFDNSYVVFEMLDSGEVSAARFIESSDSEGEIQDIETDEEWDALEKVLDQYYDDLDEEEEEEESE